MLVIHLTLNGTNTPRSRVISTIRKTSSTWRDIVFVSGFASLKPVGALSLSGHSKMPGTTCAFHLWVKQGKRIDHTWIKVSIQSAIPFHICARRFADTMLLQSTTLFASHDDASHCSKIWSLLIRNYRQHVIVIVSSYIHRIKCQAQWLPHTLI